MRPGTPQHAEHCADVVVGRREEGKASARESINPPIDESWQATTRALSPAPTCRLRLTAGLASSSAAGSAQSVCWGLGR